MRLRFVLTMKIAACVGRGRPKLLSHPSFSFLYETPAGTFREVNAHDNFLFGALWKLCVFSTCSQLPLEEK